ncbi:MAG: cytochrome c peroxidase [Planctomycetota bacterium]
MQRLWTACTTLGATAALLSTASTASAQEPVAAEPAVITELLDPNFIESATRPNETLISAGRSFGPWTVDLGNVGLHVGQFETPLGFGNVVDVNGTRAGSFYQTVNVIPGKTYTVRFLMSGNWTSNPDRPRNLSLRFGTQRVSWSMSRPTGWSPTNMQWVERTADFYASANRAAIRFSSDSSGISDGAVVARVEVHPKEQAPGPLSSTRVPLPDNLADFVQDKEKAILLGKALFWDMQVGGDGRTACATCHWNAGADIRVQNSDAPGAGGGTFGHQTSAGPALRAAALAAFRGGNKTLSPADFPFHRLQNPTKSPDHPSDTTPENPGTYDSAEIAGSQGITNKEFRYVVPGKPEDVGSDLVDPVFQVNSLNVRQVTGRNAPTNINAVFLDRLFWDGRANHYFNGVTPFGDLDRDAKVFKSGADGRLQAVSILLNNAALASQAVGPVNSSVEMSWLNRSFPEVGRKMLSLRPLALQAVHREDSVLGAFRHTSGFGLNDAAAGYAKLIREAFRPEWWSGSRPTANGYTHMEANFSLYWGISLMLYQATLISDQSPFDQFASGNQQALSSQAKEGLRIFTGAGKCADCHAGSEFAGAAISRVRNVKDPHFVIERMQMAIGKAFYDSGFYNIGVRPTAEDIGLGASHPQLGPLSYSRQEQRGKNPDPLVDVRPSDRVAVDGAFKSPSLRNIELTGPYMHNGGMKSLEEVVQFYTRGADFFHSNLQDLDPNVHGIPELQANPEKVDAVVEFLKHLTDPRVRNQAAPFDHPELILPHGHSNFKKDIVALDRLVRLPETGRSGGAPLRTFSDALNSGLQLQVLDKTELPYGGGKSTKAGTR